MRDRWEAVAVYPDPCSDWAQRRPKAERDLTAAATLAQARLAALGFRTIARRVGETVGCPWIELVLDGTAPRLPFPGRDWPYDVDLGAIETRFDVVFGTSDVCWFSDRPHPFLPGVGPARSTG